MSSDTPSSGMGSSKVNISKLGKPSALPRPSPTSGSGRSTPMRAMSREGLNVTGSRTGALDDWIVGDRCYVNGIKSGKVAFLGETRFAPGEWAGVVLDEPTGKNDGTLNGVHYFQCPAKHGVFCRISKLERFPTNATDASGKSATPGAMPQPSNSTPDNGGTLAEQMRDKLDISAVMASSVFGSGDGEEPINSPSSPSSVACDFARPSTPDAAGRSLKVGDVVIVSGNKRGVLRYLGDTAFKEGTWAGVELDQPSGKNDGSVEGKRYFVCKPRHGLFAPAYKVLRAGSPNAPTMPLMNASYAGLTNSRTSLTGVGSKRLPPAPRQTLTSAMRIQRASQSRMGSQESLSSISSFHSAASVNRRKAVAADRAGSAGPSNTGSLSSPTYVTLQDSLKEKDEHIMQLMREREIERSEMARSAQIADQAQQELSDLKAEHLRTMADHNLRMEHLQSTLEQSEKEIKRLKDLYEEERRKCEDLQFRVEEEVINRSELEAKLTDLEQRQIDTEKSENAGALAQTALEDKARELEELRIQLTGEKSRNQEVEKTAEDSRKTELELRASLLRLEASLEAEEKEHEQQRLILERSLQEAKHDLNTEMNTAIELQKAYEGMMTKATSNQTQAGAYSEQLQVLEKKIADKSAQLEQALTDKVAMETRLRGEFQAEREQLDAAKKLEDETKERLSNELTEKDMKISAMVTEQNTLREQVTKLTSRVQNDAAEGEKLKLQFEKERNLLKEAQEKNNRLRADLQNAVATQNEAAGVALESARRDYEELLGKFKKSETECNELRTEVEQACKEKILLSQESQKRNDDVSNEILQLRAKLSDAEMKTNEFRKEKSQWLQEKARLEDIQKSGQEVSNELSKLQGKLRDVENKNNILETNQKMWLHEKIQFEEKTCTLREDYDKKCIELRNAVAMVRKLQEDVSGANDQLASMRVQQANTAGVVLEESNKKLSQLKDEIGAKESQMQKAQETLKAAGERQSEATGRIEKLEQEKFELLEKLTDAESRITELAKLAVKSSGDGISDQKSNMVQYSSDAEGHTAFLNSIIADKQKEIEELNLKVAILMRGGVEGLGMSNGLPKVPTTRMFCDICDQFDLHETEDCPKQESIADEEETHSHFHGERGGKRPFCSNCEMFGHSTADCDNQDSQTY